MKKETEDSLYDLVLQAQTGDQRALQAMLHTFSPVIQSERTKIPYDRQDDLEQCLTEMMIKKILAYDVGQAPGYASFCSQLIDEKII